MPLVRRHPAPRFGRVNEPRGTLDALEPLSVRSLSPEGMLIESPNPLEVGSVHEFQLSDGTTDVRVRAVVRHASPLRQASAQGYFLVDLGFLNLTGGSSGDVERWLGGRPARPINEEA